MYDDYSYQIQTLDRRIDDMEYSIRNHEFEIGQFDRQIGDLKSFFRTELYSLLEMIDELNKRLTELEKKNED